MNKFIMIFVGLVVSLLLAFPTIASAAPTKSLTPEIALTSKMECTPTLPVGPLLCAKVYGPKNSRYVDEVFYSVNAAPGNPWCGRVWFQMRPYAKKGVISSIVPKASKSGCASNDGECKIFQGYIAVEDSIPRNGRWKIGVWSAPGFPENSHVLEGTIHG